MNLNKNNVKVKKTALHSVEETGAEIKRLIETYHFDVEEYDDVSFLDFYDMVRELEYIDDGRNECLARPKILLRKNPPFRDCDDKAVLLGSWLYRHKIPFAVCACSYEAKDEIHHCVIAVSEFSALRMLGQVQPYSYANLTKKRAMEKLCVVVDATYLSDSFPAARPYYNIEPITGWIYEGTAKI